MGGALVSDISLNLSFVCRVFQHFRSPLASGEDEAEDEDDDNNDDGGVHNEAANWIDPWPHNN